MAVHPSAAGHVPADRAWTRDLAVLVAGVGLGLAVGLRRAPSAHPTDGHGAEGPIAVAATATSDPAPSAALERASAPPPLQPASPDPHPPSSDLARAELSAALEVNEGELRSLARALADPAAYRHVRAVLGDLASFEAALRRREELHRQLDAEPPPAPELPRGLREKAHALIGSRSALLVVDVVDAPAKVEVLRSASTSTTAPARAGVVLANDGPARTVSFRTRVDGLERLVEVREDVHAGCDRIRVTYGVAGGPPSFTRSARLVGPPGRVWQDLIAHLWERGAVPFHALESLVDGGAAAVPSRRGGWIDWVRLHVGLPPNPELNEPVGPPPPLPSDNPLLLVGGAAEQQPMLLERPDLELDPEHEGPPLMGPARGPLVFIASNALGVFDGEWRWLVFDPARGRVVEHLPGAGPGGGHVRWELLPDPERTRLGRGPELSQALAQLAQERTRQVLALLLRRREVAALEREQEARVGGMYTADGLAVVRLAEEIVDRHKKLQALSHLLLDADAAAQSDRAVEEARRRSVARLARMIEAMIDADRRGPAEYLLRDERVKAMLFEAPQAYRLRLCQAFRARYGSWHAGLLAAFGAHPPQWYEVQ